MQKMRLLFQGLLDSRKRHWLWKNCDVQLPCRNSRFSECSSEWPSHQALIIRSRTPYPFKTPSRTSFEELNYYHDEAPELFDLRTDSKVKTLNPVCYQTTKYGSAALRGGFFSKNLTEFKTCHMIENSHTKKPVIARSLQ